MYVEDLKRGTNKDIGPKDIFETGSKSGPVRKRSGFPASTGIIGEVEGMFSKRSGWSGICWGSNPSRSGFKASDQVQENTRKAQADRESRCSQHM